VRQLTQLNFYYETIACTQMRAIINMLSVLIKAFLISLCRNELLESKFFGLFIVNHSQQSVNAHAASRLICTEYKRLPNTVRTLDVCTGYTLLLFGCACSVL